MRPDEWRLVVDHLYIADRVSRRIVAPEPFDQDDVYQLAVEALIRCAQTWQTAHGVPFEPFAQQRVKWWTLRERDKLRWGGAWSAERLGPLSYFVDTDPEILSHVDYTEMEVREFLDSLSPKKRQVVVLRMAGLNHREIGDMNGKSESASTMLMRRLATEWPDD